MPGFDGTGPRGMGPMTGRGLGPCGCGRGFRRGFGRGFWAEPTKEQEIADLKAEKGIIEQELESIKKRLSELEKQ